MSDTPRTDDVAMSSEDYEAMYEHAQRLERELTATEKLMDEKHAKAVAIADKLAEARAEIERLRGEIEKAHEEGCLDGRKLAHPDSNGNHHWNHSRAKRVMEGKG